MGAHTHILTDQERLDALREGLDAAGFSGDFETDLGARLVAATDNSIYEVLPDAITYPREGNDINRIVRASVRLPLPLALTARGGNTGTNGQSLNRGVIVDCGRHLNRILATDIAGQTVTAEPGVVLDQLNAALADHGLFFPPTVSTASRATLGGMVATDASGKGSRHYGKTSDYIEALDVVLSDGSDWRIEAMSVAEAERLAAGQGLVADIHRETLRIVRERADEIEATFPRMNRGLTGYNLQKAYDAATGRVSLAYLMAGAEGTLGIVKAIKLRVSRRPTHRHLAVIRYDDFDGALRDVERLLAADPLAVEILDDKVLGVARSDVLWSSLEGVLGGTGERIVRALNFVEFTGSSAGEVTERRARLDTLLETPAAAMIDCRTVDDPATIRSLWQLREKSVGLLARLGGGRQGAPFVEDTAVPPERLADYVAEFRALLDGHGLQYGMFGHADVGCLHVRPFLDMKDPAQAALVRPVSDAVAALTRKHGGLLWGEHGRGFRGEYSPFFFGEALYPELRRLKAAFDPRAIFNPGKLASPPDGPALDRIDGVPLRGEQDRLIDPELLAEFDRAVACNGNGACFSWDALDAMCPSYKATRDRAQSPKGRAALLRAWGRLASTGEASAELAAIEIALERSLSTCLSCKACTTACPVKVDVPAMKSRFLARHYRRRPRPLRHVVLRHSETMFALGRTAPRLANAILQSRAGRFAANHWLRMADMPRFSARGSALPPPASPRQIARSERSVILIEDSFTASFDRAVMVAAARLLETLGYSVFRMPARKNGKMLHLLGLRDSFASIARARMAECAALASAGARLVGLDAVTMLMHEQEYREFADASYTVSGLDQVLADDIDAGRIAPGKTPVGPTLYQLLGHCTETALRPGTLDRWARILGHFGIAASPVRSGCCGMAGLFGHETDHLDMSRRLFDMSWRVPVEAHPRTVLATGYSCRAQAARYAGIRPRHPIELLAAHLASTGDA